MCLILFDKSVLLVVVLLWLHGFVKIELCDGFNFDQFKPGDVIIEHFGGFSDDVIEQFGRFVGVIVEQICWVRFIVFKQLFPISFVIVEHLCPVSTVEQFLDRFQVDGGQSIVVPLVVAAITELKRTIMYSRLGVEPLPC